jgi:ribosome biogenesis GTPase
LSLHSVPQSSASSADFPLDRLGWDLRLETAFSEYAVEGAVPGRVARADGAQCTVLTGMGPLRAASTARLRKADDATDLPTVGDWVAVLPAAGPEGSHAVVAVLPRSSAFIRGTAGEQSTAQVLAANVDTVLVVAGLATRPNLRRLERFLALAWESGAQPVVVLTKSDLCDDVDAAVADVAAVAPGVAVHALSSRDGSGLEALDPYLAAGQTIALLGSSGVGKSTLVNTLAGSEVMRTHDIRDDGKGRHTTTHRELVVLPCGAVLIDTPGLRAVQLWDAQQGLEQAFSDVEVLTTECRFHDCAHETEPGCAVLGAVESGTLALARLDSYRRLQRESAWMANRHDARLRAEARKKWKTRAKEYRARPSPKL